MKVRNLFAKAAFALVILIGLGSCKKDDVVLETSTINYSFNTGQVAASFAYSGTHATTLSLDMLLEEQEDGGTKITITLNNTMDGETYAIHAHDAADAASTPNNTPYNETPNGDVLVAQISGNGSSQSISQTTTKSFTEITTIYDAFIVVHDPLQAMSTVDPTTYVILGAFAR